MAVLSFPFPVLSRRGRVFLLMTLAGLAAGLDRDGLVAAVGGVRDFLRVPNDDLEIAYGALTLGLFLSLVGGGFFAEWLGAKRALTICGAVAAAASVLTGFAWSLTALVLFRLALGLAVGAVIPISVVALQPWTPPPERGWAQGLLQAGLASGGVLAWPIVVGTEALGSWRAAFVLFGLLGALWILAWHSGFEELPQGGETGRRPPIYWRGALRIMALPMMLAFIQGWGVELCWHWLPPFLVSYWHFDIKLSPIVGFLTTMAPILGSVIGGLAADLSIRHSGNIKSAHQLTPGVGFLLAAVSLMMLPVGENEIAIAIWLSLALMGLQAAGVLLWVIAMDVGGLHPGVSAAFIGLGMVMARLLSPAHLAALTGAWPVPLFLGIPLLIVAGCFAFRLRPHIELPRLPAAPPPPATDADEEGAAV